MRYFFTLAALSLTLLSVDCSFAQNRELAFLRQSSPSLPLQPGSFAASQTGRMNEGPESEFESEFEISETESPFDEPIETDRHDFTQSPKVVGCGVKQLEYGVFYATLLDGTERETTYATPELVLRCGLSDSTEFRVRFNYGWKYNNEEEDIQGSEDLIFGIKYQLSEHSNWKPASAVELRLSAPTGADDLSTGRWEPGIDFIYGWEFGEKYSFTGSTGGNANALGDIGYITVDTDPNDHFIAWTQSFALGAGLTKRSTGYFEWYGVFTHGRDDDNSLSFVNLGLDYLISNNVVIDFRVGWGLTRASDDVFAGIGGAFRF